MVSEPINQWRPLLETKRPKHLQKFGVVELGEAHPRQQVGDTFSVAIGEAARAHYDFALVVRAQDLMNRPNLPGLGLLAEFSPVEEGSPGASARPGALVESDSLGATNLDDHVPLPAPQHGECALRLAPPPEGAGAGADDGPVSGRVLLLVGPLREPYRFAALPG